MLKVSRTHGFTLVELLIVIVVIGILAAITIVAYNGVQTKAENSKTLSAVTAWAKTIRMYHIETGNWPDTNSCLGSSTTYTDTYSGRCWPSETSGWIVQPAFLSELQSYTGNSFPEPSNKNINTDTSQYRGAMFYRASSTDIRIYVELLGTTTCPSISGLGSAFSGVTYPGGRSCYYRLAGP